MVIPIRYLASTSRLGLWLLIAFAGSLPVVSLAQKVMVENSVEQRTVAAFSAISVSGAIDVHISQDNNSKVVVAASDEKIRNNIQTVVNNGVLTISYKSPVSLGSGKKWMRVYVAVPMLTSIVSSGASDVYVEGRLEADELEIVLSGASDFRGDVVARHLSLVGSGSADFRLAGQSQNLVINVSGASDVAGKDHRADYCVVHANGSSDVTIGVQKELTATASGASDIKYYGAPVIKDMRTTGASTLRKVN